MSYADPTTIRNGLTRCSLPVMTVAIDRSC
jgi:hypothetical protein